MQRTDLARLIGRFARLFTEAGLTVDGTPHSEPQYDSVLDLVLFSVGATTAAPTVVPAGQEMLALALLNYYAYDAALPGLITRVNQSADEPTTSRSLSDMARGAATERDKAKAEAERLGWSSTDGIMFEIPTGDADWEYAAAARKGRRYPITGHLGS